MFRRTQRSQSISHLKRTLKNERGQMALFLVLVFQILFVFFAMSINVGLVVYDKINLQNSTDLAAYYAAQKQSEMLNQIAHINYQMRQAYKLLTFRLRVIGSVSVGLGVNSVIKRHPILTTTPIGIGDESRAFFESPGQGRQSPAVCIGSTLWEEYAKTEGSVTSSLCQNLDGFSVVPPITSIPDPLGLVGTLNNYLTAISANAELKCKTVSVLNWQVAASFLTAYILESKRRSAMINTIATEMSQPAQQMKDFLGQSVYTGTLKTLQKNLTEPQRDSLSMTLENSLSTDIPGECSKPSYWLPTVDLYPAMAYVRMIYGGIRCATEIVPNRSASGLPPSDYIAMVGGRNNQMLADVWTNSAPITFGFEKNPWCMPYMHVKATTNPRKIFSPFGGAMTLTAESFAKPFGGRIGPWYSTQWPAGSETSQGAQRVDPLLPARSIAGNRTPGDPKDDIVNHSKYPGDKLGMNSVYALEAMKSYAYTLLRGNMVTNMAPIFSLANYNHVGDPQEFDSRADSLVRTNSPSLVSGEVIRAMEETALAPDLFDITYYSIEAQYSPNYFSDTDPHFSTAGNFPSGNFFVDLGSDNRQSYSVLKQITRSNTLFKSQEPFYQITDANQLLTGWTQNKVVNYDFPDDFGNCLKRRDDEMAESPSPGGCPAGGRSGYSVKIVSKNYLKTISSPLGGAGMTGSILNPPKN